MAESGGSHAAPVGAVSLADCAVVDFSTCGAQRYKPWVAPAPPTDPAVTCRGPPSDAYRGLVAAWQRVHAAVVAAG
jgi:hypothetical protein